MSYVLQNNTVGQDIQDYYNQCNDLNERSRDNLCDIILNREKRGRSEFPKITPERYKELTSEICNLFKSEVVGTYYIPRIPKCGTIPAVNAKGKLPNHYVYMKRRSHERAKQIQQKKNLLNGKFFS